MEVNQPFDQLYDELRELARRQRRRWEGDHTLNTTALLHEAYLKLAGAGAAAPAERAHFLSLAARAMRQILCNYSRDRRALKRGGGIGPVTLRDAAPEPPTAETAAETLAALDEALTRLEQERPRQARVVECRFFGGLDVEETAAALGISPRTVKRDWAAAQEWLRAELAPVTGGADDGTLDELASRTLPAVIAAVGEAPLPERPIAGRYDIVRRIGRGGMGVVYEAHDRELDRRVALKFVAQRLAATDDARERLRREARAASALDHPAINVVYDIGTTDPAPGGVGERLFIAMAYCAGGTLQDRIARGPLSIADVLGYAIQVADGLARAHAAGIVHRDVKPANLLLTDDGRVRIADFGIATAVRGDTAGERGAAGTAAYVSPEQAAGARADGRSDVWSLGVVLYEMLAGVRPFRGREGAAVLRALQEERPPPVEVLRPDVPARLLALVRHCLARDPAARPDAAAVHRELVAISERGLEPEPPSVLVLPFDGIGTAAGDEYLADGLTEEVIATLARVDGLRVVSRTTAMRFRGGPHELSTVARDAGVRYLLEGGVRKAGDALRITARLVEPLHERQLWAGTYTGTLADLFDIQEQVARGVAEALSVHLSSDTAQALARRPLPDPRAYEAYLRARYEAWRFTRDGLERARRYLDTALAMVGENELLLSTLGHVVAGYREAGIDPEGTALGEVDAIADRIFALDRDAARGHLLKGLAAFHGGNVVAALRWSERATRLDPDDPDTLLLLAYVQAHVGRMAEARAVAQRVLRLDPLTPLVHAVQGFNEIVEGRFDEAVPHYRRCLEMDPDSPFAAVCLGWSLAYARRYDEAVVRLHDAADRHPGTAFACWGRSLAHALRGERRETVRAITPVMETTARGSEMFARATAQSLALAGETGAALEWLEREIELGMLNYDYLAEHDWFLEPLRGERRFVELMERVRELVAAA